MKYRIDINLWLSGIRTAGALLMGNSVLIYTEVIENSLTNRYQTETLVMFLGLTMILLTSLTKGVDHDRK